MAWARRIISRAQRRVDTAHSRNGAWKNPSGRTPEDLRGHSRCPFIAVWYGIYYYFGCGVRVKTEMEIMEIDLRHVFVAALSLLCANWMVASICRDALSYYAYHTATRSRPYCIVCHSPSDPCWCTRAQVRLLLRAPRGRSIDDRTRAGVPSRDVDVRKNNVTFDGRKLRPECPLSSSRPSGGFVSVATRNTTRRGDASGELRRNFQ